MFFSKELVCEECKIKTSKKNICTFDYSRQGRIKEGVKIKVCQRCCLDKLINDLKKHTNRAVIVQPSNQYNTYAFYDFKELLDASKNSLHKNKDIKSVEDLRSLLPEEHTKCNSCANIAIYTWCSLDIYKYNPFSMEIYKTEKFECIHLCRDCLIDLFSKKVKEDNIRFRVVFPMVNEDGFYTPWEV